MKQYPSILSSQGALFREFDAYIFDKLDGSNLRFEWSRKAGWNKFGTRSRLFDLSDWQFGRAIPIFLRNLSEPLTKAARDNRWESMIVFAEHFGPSSFAGIHHEPITNKPLDLDDAMKVVLFDIAPHRHGLLGPREFLRIVEKADVPHASYLGQCRWTRGFVDRVRAGEIDGITFEGVVGKAGNGKSHDLIMAKAKTQIWIDKVKARYSAIEAERILES